MSRVALSKIKSLTFYKDSLTTSRRGGPIPQLNCIGKPCNLYTPDAVRCVSVGGEGTDVDWKCEADLPEALRFGRVEVSCEGWDGPGDPYVLKGSCGLDYRLVQVPSSLRGNMEDHSSPSRIGRWLGTQDLSSILFMLIWTAVLLFILYGFLKSCFGGESGTSGPRSPRRPGPSPGPGWFPGTYDNGPTDSPPPYSKHSDTSTSASPAQERGWRPGFWTGAAAAGLGTYLFSNTNRQDRTRTTAYDWERTRQATGYRPSSFSSSYSSRQRTEDRGEGSSSLGSMRRSTGIGGSSVR